MSSNDKDKNVKPRKSGRAVAPKKPEAPAVRAAASAKPPAVPKSARKTEKTTARAPKAAEAVSSETARPKRPARTETARKRTTAKVPPVTQEREADRDITFVPPHSTIEGAPSHAAAIGPNSVIAVRSTAYEMTPPDRIVEPLYPEERVQDLPPQYEDTRLTLMVRDPEWLFFYWEVGRPVREMLGLPVEGPIRSMVVRLHDVTGVEEFNGINSVVWYEIPLGESAVSWYVHLPQVDREWCAELGVLNERGEFVQICRSNSVRTPRNFISEHSDPEWMSVSEELREILARSADVALAGASQMGSQAAIRQISRRLRLAIERAAGASAMPVASMRAARIVQKAQQPVSRAADLPLSVRTELVVSGATDASAQVTIQGQPVTVRSDGTFSLRFELPDGEQVLPVRAMSSDGTLTREIVPAVRRETRQP